VYANQSWVEKLPDTLPKRNNNGVDDEGDDEEGAEATGGGTVTPAMQLRNKNLKKFREQLRRHGANGILGLSRRFRILDTEGDGLLSYAEFVQCLHACEIYLSEEESRSLFELCDQDRSGTISYAEFLSLARVGYRVVGGYIVGVWGGGRVSNTIWIPCLYERFLRSRLSYCGPGCVVTGNLL